MSTRRDFIGSTAGLIGAPALLHLGSASAQTSTATAKFKSQWDVIKNHYPISRTYKYTSAKSIVTITTNRVRVSQSTNFYEIPYAVTAKKETLNNKGIYVTTWFNEFNCYTYINLRSNNTVRSSTSLWLKNGGQAVFPGTSLAVNTLSFRAEDRVEPKEELRRRLQNGWTLRTWMLLVPLVCYSIRPEWNARNISRSGMWTSPWAGWTEFVGTINGVTDTYRKIYVWDGTGKKWIWALIRPNQSTSQASTLEGLMTNMDNLRVAVSNMWVAASVGVPVLTAGLWEGSRVLWALIYADDDTDDGVVYGSIIAGVAIATVAVLMGFRATAQNRRKSIVTSLNSLITLAGRVLVDTGVISAEHDPNGFLNMDVAPIDAHLPQGTETQWATPPQGTTNAMAGLFLDPPEFVPDPLRIV